MSRLLVELPVNTVDNTHAFYSCFLYVVLGQGLGTEIVCQISDTVPYREEKQPKTACPAYTEKFVYRIVYSF